MRFYTTNRKDDPGEEISEREIARRFWGSEMAATWQAHGGMFERSLRCFLGNEVGGWDGDDATMNQFYALLEVVWNARPPVETVDDLTPEQRAEFRAAFGDGVGA